MGKNFEKKIAKTKKEEKFEKTSKTKRDIPKKAQQETHEKKSLPEVNEEE